VSCRYRPGQLEPWLWRNAILGLIWWSSSRPLAGKMSAIELLNEADTARCARGCGCASYLDGARLWNAAVACGRPASECAAPFDLVSVALSKGLGAPGGSLLAGSVDTIKRCLRYRRMLGGAMRQVGLFAAAGLYALDHNMNRLADDHANARLIAEKIATSHRIIVDLATVQTNILVFRLSSDAPDAPTVVARARERGLLVFAFGPRTIRAVTHLDVSQEQCERAADLLLDIVDQWAG
jgi:threonine aldolase